MRTQLVTAAATSYIITLTEVKHHLGVSTAALINDNYIKSLSKLAVERIQDLTGMRLIKQTWKYYLDDWPYVDHIELPYYPLISVTSVAFITTTGGTAVSMGATRWNADTVSSPPGVYLEYGDTWPSTGLYDHNPIRVEAIYGCSSGSTSIPKALKHAAKFLISHWYENREMGIVRGSYSPIPDTVKALVAPYKSWNMRSF